jgi:opacity protein-like surface antigen
MGIRITKIRVLIIVFLGVLPLIISPAAIAQEWSRAGKGEIFVLGQNMSGDTATGDGIEIELDDTTVFGIGLGVNDKNINFNLDIFFGSTDTEGRGPGPTLTADTDLFGLDLNLDYNFLETRFTPLITGGIGYINFNGTWRGDSGTSDFSETDFSYNLGAGFRWDVTDRFLMKAVYRATWTKLKDTDDSIQFKGISVSIGYLF